MGVVDELSVRGLDIGSRLRPSLPKGSGGLGEVVLVLGIGARCGVVMAAEAEGVPIAAELGSRSVVLRCGLTGGVALVCAKAKPPAVSAVASVVRTARVFRRWLMMMVSVRFQGDTTKTRAVALTTQGLCQRFKQPRNKSCLAPSPSQSES